MFLEPLDIYLLKISFLDRITTHPLKPENKCKIYFRLKQKLLLIRSFVMLTLFGSEPH